LPSLEDAAFARLETALRAICNLILSGFTRNTTVSLSRVTMVPTMPPLVTTLSPDCNSDSIF